jgi:cytochrome o ubiquinol oxidase subunit 1
VIVGIGFQILQFIVSIRQRHQNLDKTGDPWDGRTLEWSTASPPPFYNFSSIPMASERDAYWQMKKTKPVTTADYHSIRMPKNSIVPLIIALFGFGFGFGMIWHIYWLVLLSALGIVTSVIIRSTSEDNEYTVPAAKVRRTEEELKERYA